MGCGGGVGRAGRNQTPLWSRCLPVSTVVILSRGERLPYNVVLCRRGEMLLRSMSFGTSPLGCENIGAALRKEQQLRCQRCLHLAQNTLATFVCFFYL